MEEEKNKDKQKPSTGKLESMDDEDDAVASDDGGPAERAPIGKDTFTDIESKASLARLFVGSVAGEAVLREDRTHVPTEVDTAFDSLGRCRAGGIAGRGRQLAALLRRRGRKIGRGTRPHGRALGLRRALSLARAALRVEPDGGQRERGTQERAR